MSSLAVAITHHHRSGFHLDIRAGLPMCGVTGIAGPSGSGKTTLLNCIAGLRPDIGDIAVQLGSECWDGPGQRVPPWKRGLGFVFQDARLFPHLSVAGNLDYAVARRHGNAPARDDVLAWLDIAGLQQRDVATLSGGQAQRVAIARALLSAPRLLLLDEPLANLDRPAARHCLACLQRVSRESGLPMLYVSHHVEEIAAIADHLLVLRDGRVEAHGELPDLLSRLDSSLAVADDAAAVLFTEATGQCADGLCELRADDRCLYVAGHAAAGQRQRLRVAARDVSVCREQPRGTSILNILPVVLEDLRSLSDTHCLLRLRLESQWLLARITERSRRELALRRGDPLYAQIKSTALLDEPTP